MTQTIAVVDYGSGNLHSVSRAIARVGGSALVTPRRRARSPRADALVIPGVGHFGACMRAICHHGMDRAIEDFRVTGRPVFGVCVGHAGAVRGKRRGPRARPRRARPDASSGSPAT